MKAGTSIGANLEEGRAGQSRADFIAKFAIARKECCETSYWLRLLLETVDQNADKIKALNNEAQQLLNIISSIILSAKKNDKP